MKRNKEKENVIDIKEAAEDVGLGRRRFLKRLSIGVSMIGSFITKKAEACDPCLNYCDNCNTTGHHCDMDGHCNTDVCNSEICNKGDACKTSDYCHTYDECREDNVCEKKHQCKTDHVCPTSFTCRDQHTDCTWFDTIW